MHFTHKHSCISHSARVTHSHTARDLARACAGLWMKLSVSTGTRKGQNGSYTATQFAGTTPTHSPPLTIRCFQLHKRVLLRRIKGYLALYGKMSQERFPLDKFNDHFHLFPDELC